MMTGKFLKTLKNSMQQIKIKKKIVINKPLILLIKKSKMKLLIPLKI
jgi:hypothetical protein